MRLFQTFGFGLIVTVALMAGCKTSAPAPTIMGASGTLPVEILDSHAGSDEAFKSAGASGYVLINEKKEAYAAIDAALEPDYATQSVVVITLGEMPTAGYSYNVLGAQTKNAHLWVQFSVVMPEEGAAEVIDYPYTAILIPKFEGTVHPEPME